MSDIQAQRPSLAEVIAELECKMIGTGPDLTVGTIIADSLLQVGERQMTNEERQDLIASIAIARAEGGDK